MDQNGTLSAALADPIHPGNDAGAHAHCKPPPGTSNLALQLGKLAPKPHLRFQVWVEAGCGWEVGGLVVWVGGGGVSGCWWERVDV